MTKTAKTAEGPALFKLRGHGYVLFGENGDPVELHGDEVISEKDDRVADGQGYKLRPATDAEVQRWAALQRRPKPPEEGGGVTSEDRSSDGGRGGSKIAEARAKVKNRKKPSAEAGEGKPDPASAFDNV